MSIPKEILQKVEDILGESIADIKIPSSGFDHTVFTFKTSIGIKYIAKADHNAVVDALVLKEISKNGILIPVPTVIGYSEEDKVVIFEFIEGNMLETLSIEVIRKHLPRLLEIVSKIHTIKASSAGDFLSVYKGKGMSWKDFFGLKYKRDHSYYVWDNLINDKKVDGDLILKTLDKINSEIEFLEEPLEYSLLHSDIHGGNIIADNNEIKALIDWSDANYGDPLYDFSRLRLFLVNNDAEMLNTYYTYLDMDEIEKKREELYYLGHILRIIFFSHKENIPQLFDSNYEKLKLI